MSRILNLEKEKSVALVSQLTLWVNYVQRTGIFPSLGSRTESNALNPTAVTVHHVRLIEPEANPNRRLQGLSAGCID